MRDNHWCKSNEEVDVFFHVVSSLLMRHSIKHLSCTLRMANIGHILDTCLTFHKIDLCLDIVFAHFSKREIPKILPFSFVTIWIKTNMLSTVFTASVVSKPDIIAFIGKDKSWSLITMWNNPWVSSVTYTMLKEDNWLGFRPIGIYKFRISDSVNFQNISVFSCSLMLFK